MNIRLNIATTLLIATLALPVGAQAETLCYQSSKTGTTIGTIGGSTVGAVLGVSACIGTSVATVFSIGTFAPAAIFTCSLATTGLSALGGAASGALAGNMVGSQFDSTCVETDY